MLDDVGQALGHHEVGGVGDGVAQPADGSLQPGGDGHAVDEVLGGGVQPALDERGGHQVVDESPQIGGGRVDVLTQPRGAVFEGAAGRRAQPLRIDGEHDEAGLEPVVEVAGDPPPLMVGRLDQTSSSTSPTRANPPRSMPRPKATGTPLTTASWMWKATSGSTPSSPLSR